MLDLLDESKVGPLGGRLSAQKLRDLEHALRNGQNQELDPDLKDLMKQIDLRVRVDSQSQQKLADNSQYFVFSGAELHTPKCQKCDAVRP